MPGRQDRVALFPKDREICAKRRFGLEEDFTLLNDDRANPTRYHEQTLIARFGLHGDRYFLCPRIREIQYGPRTIDIDILYYGERIIDIENLKIPHPHIQKRRFILVPLSEILPQMHHPFLKKSNQKLLDDVKDDGKVTKWQP